MLCRSIPCCDVRKHPFAKSSLSLSFSKLAYLLILQLIVFANVSPTLEAVSLSVTEPLVHRICAVLVRPRPSFSFVLVKSSLRSLDKSQYVLRTNISIQPYPNGCASRFPSRRRNLCSSLKVLTDPIPPLLVVQHSTQRSLGHLCHHLPRTPMVSDPTSLPQCPR